MRNPTSRHVFHAAASRAALASEVVGVPFVRFDLKPQRVAPFLLSSPGVKTPGCWEHQPLLRIDPKLIGDFRKGLVFVEIQFGNSSALYRDYYKFQYGLLNGLLSLSVLIVPTRPSKFFPTRPNSVQNMAEYDFAHTCLTVLPINTPVLLVGLLPEN